MAAVTASATDATDDCGNPVRPNPDDPSDPLNPEQDDDDDSIILLGPDEHRVVDEAVAVLANDPCVYQRGGLLVRVINVDNEVSRRSLFPAGPRIVPLSHTTLRERLSAVATWAGRGEGGGEVAPPPPIVNAVLDRASWQGIRQLTSIVEYPVALPDGSILSRAGYDAASGIFFSPRCPIELSVPESPTIEDARRAVAELLEVIDEFPFAGECHRSAWMAAMLTPLARFAFRGCAPLFLAEANVPAAGKGLLVDVAALIVRGAGAHCDDSSGGR